MTRWLCLLAVATAVVVGGSFPGGGLAFAQDAAAATEAAAPAAPAAPEPPTMEATYKNLWVAADTVWVLVCAMLVFFMNLGFGCVESGFARSKNCVNILSKNFIVFAATCIAYYLFGWDLMFGAGDGALVGNSGSWMVGAADNSPAVGNNYQGQYGSISWASVPLWTKFFFQLVFAGTAATIVSGAVAERIKYHSFIIFSFLMALVIYPITGHWIWGFGYLAKEWNFWDFAGCTAVHSVGGWAALTGAIILGPRIGKYAADGRVQAIPGHNMMAAFIGCLVLWFGWFGFNPGSTFGVAADGGALASQVAVNTNSAAAAATLTATLTAWLLLGKPDIGMTLNGCLAGLVGITASAAFTNVHCALLIGAIALPLSRCSPSPGGRRSWSIAAPRRPSTWSPPGLFFGGGTKQLIAQLVGVLMVGAYVVPVSAICWLLIKAVVGLRVGAHEEVGGLDIGEHGNEAYHGFVMVRSE